MKTEKIRIVVNDSGAHVFVGGKDVTENCVGYEVKQEAGRYARLELRYVYYTEDIDIDGDCLVKEVT